MPDITIHINTENITPDELEKLHRDIAHIKSLITNIVVQGLRASPRLIAGIEEGLRVLTSLSNSVAEQVSGVSGAQRHVRTNPLSAIVQQEHPQPPQAGAKRKYPLSAIVQQEPLSHRLQESLSHRLRGVRGVHTLQQQGPILETIEQVKRSIALLPQPNASVREGQRQHITPSVTEDMQPVTEDTQHHSTRHLTDITRAQQTFINTIADVPNDLLNATHEALIAVPAQTREALLQLKIETEQDIAEINDSAVLSAQEKAARIEQIERNAAQRRKQIEAEANQAKIASFNKVVANFVRGIGRMIAEQVKLRIASQVLGAQQTIVPFFATHPVLSIGAAALFSSSFDDPINDALAQQAGIRQAQQRATALGRRSAIDLKQNFEMGFVRETERHTVSTQRTENPAPIVKNEVKLIIGGQELKAIYEETQRQIEMGVISI